MTRTFRRLNFEQRVAAVGAALLLVSAIGPFSFVEAAVVLTALAVLGLLRQRAEGNEFHLPFGDGTVILAAGLWAGLLIVVRLFDRPLGQSILALGCAAIVAGAGARERAKRPMDDLPEGPAPEPASPAPMAPTVPLREPPAPPLREPPAPPPREPPAPPPPEEAPTVRLPPRER